VAFNMRDSIFLIMTTAASLSAVISEMFALTVATILFLARTAGIWPRQVLLNLAVVLASSMQSFGVRIPLHCL
jgi:hypothetical protein